MFHFSRKTFTISIISALLIAISTFIVYGATIEDRIRALAGVGGAAHAWGVFRTANGNAGLLNFGAAPVLGGYTGGHVLSSLSGDTIINTLTGFFWMENIGWVGAGGVTLHPDPSGNPRAEWTLSGHLWSDSAGWIDMNSVVFVPDNTFFSGFAWNDGVGWIDIWGATLASTSDGFIGMVKVLGAVGGSRVFNTVYDVSQGFSSTSITPIINKVQKNLALSLRNAGTNQINPVGTSSINAFKDSVIYQNTGSTLSVVRYSDTTFRRIGLENVRTIVVVGADVYIDEAVLTPIGDTRPRAIITLQNSKGIGGNIYIAGNPTRIESSLIAEGSIFSAFFPSTTTTEYIYYNSEASMTTALPDRQLYIFGSVISHNTIGGATPGDGSTYICPYIEINCTRDTAIKYDFNYFRDYQKDPVKRGYKSDIYDDYSMIVEYNPLLLRDPPPLLTQ